MPVSLFFVFFFLNLENLKGKTIYTGRLDQLVRLDNIDFLNKNIKL